MTRVFFVFGRRPDDQNVQDDQNVSERSGRGRESDRAERGWAEKSKNTDFEVAGWCLGLQIASNKLGVSLFRYPGKDMFEGLPTAQLDMKSTAPRNIILAHPTELHN